MKKLFTLAKSDGFHMPGEFEPHQGCIMIFPERPGSWPYDAVPAAKKFTEIIKLIADDEKVYVIVSDKTESRAAEMLSGTENIRFVKIPQNDSWARDTAPTFVVGKDGTVRGINWKFNAWGGTYDGLYSDWSKDDLLAERFCNSVGFDFYDAHDFVLEGGAIHSDGEGTIMVTESCLLSKGRNPHMNKEEITETLCRRLGADKVIWLPRGIFNDETNEHVDNVCAFIRPGEVVLAWTDDEYDPQYPLSMACMEVLQRESDAKGRKITVHKLPIPEYPVRVTEADMEGYVFEDGEAVREVGERLAASYVNFYFTNNSVILPQFGGENSESDKLAAEIMAKLCPERKIVPVAARDIIVGGGNIHCITQQIPKGAKHA
ncbi:MAG: agmatine deiminase [Oscillospiraceae bacterium]|nr:agmatine deiminase [Oscillospiraceae bacterium]